MQTPLSSQGIEKLFNLHKNNTKFTYEDGANNFTLTHEKVNLKAESNMHQDLMLGLWALFDCTYFKDIGEEELSVLNYITKDLPSIPKRDQKRFKEIKEPKTLKGKRHKLEPQGQVSENSTVDMSQQNKEVSKLYKELRELQIENEGRINRIYQRIHGQSNELNAQLFQGEQIGTIDEHCPILSGYRAAIQRARTLQYLKYQINTLQKKQIAQSISKVNSKKKIKEGSLYEISFEQGMGIGSIWMSEGQLLELNRLRDISLFQMYAVGWKSRFNYISHNYYGFQMLLERQRLQPISIKPSQVLSKLRQQVGEGRLSETDAEAFAEMQSCHECKLLYNKNILTKCRYVSSKHKHSMASFQDPYIYMMLRNEPKSAAVIGEDWKVPNPIRQYNFKDGEYSCGRYYCKMCKKKNELPQQCKFCLQICMCSRCIRSNTINKLTTMFIMLGGDKAFLTEQSYYAVFQNKRISSKKGKSGSIDVKLREKTVASYKMQLQQLRLLSRLVLQREELKQQQFLNEQQIVATRLVLNDSYS